MSQRCWDSHPHMLVYWTFYKKHKLFMQSGKNSKIFLLLGKNKTTGSSMALYEWKKELGRNTRAWGMNRRQICVVWTPCLLPQFSERLREPVTLQTSNRPWSSWKHAQVSYRYPHLHMVHHRGCKSSKSTRVFIKYHGC